MKRSPNILTRSTRSTDFTHSEDSASSDLSSSHHMHHTGGNGANSSENQDAAPNLPSGSSTNTQSQISVQSSSSSSFSRKRASTSHSNLREKRTNISRRNASVDFASHNDAHFSATKDHIIILEDDDGEDTPNTNSQYTTSGLATQNAESIFLGATTEEDESVISTDDFARFRDANFLNNRSGITSAAHQQSLTANSSSIQQQHPGLSSNPSKQNTENKSFFGTTINSLLRKFSPRSSPQSEKTSLLAHLNASADQSQYTTPSMFRSLDMDTSTMVPSNLSFTASPSYLHHSMQDDESGSPSYYYQHANSLANLRSDSTQPPTTPQLGSILPSSSNDGYMRYLHLSDKQEHQAVKVTWNKCILSCISVVFLVVLICFIIFVSTLLFFRDAHFQVDSVQVLRIPTYKNMHILFRIELSQYNPNAQEIELLLDRVNLRLALLDLKSKTKHQLYHPINADTGFNITEIAPIGDSGITKMVIDSDIYVGDVPYIHDIINYFKPQKVNSVAWKMNGELQYKCMFLTRLVELNHIQRLYINNNQKKFQHEAKQINPG
eukprot:CAMPEP_0117436716 /NCGR_PEP_ID=MMETSP0759-20121206/1149_1 /TAXON_ID=63605 /ORGANISM="Percolomonas cosmopolitus, Strain WS" /LENGTH=550 /DNA_ID=CAMNT_0005228321 /DNA_START=110 /DNA_END=1762 /DNA_ORIENTATION=+